MKRTDVTNLFPDATDEQVNALMNINGNDINNAKKGVEELQASLRDAQAKLANTDTEALQNALDKAQALQTELDTMKASEAVRLIREDVAKTLGVPSHLLHGETKEDCEAQAKAIIEYAKPSAYPTVRDGGEIIGDSQQSTRDQFATWLNEFGGNK